MLSAAKAALRRELLEKRRKISPELLSVRSRRLCENLSDFLEARGFRELASFRSFRGEPILETLEQNWTRPLYFPRVDATTRRMSFHRWSPGESFELNHFGIEEPAASGVLLVPSTETAILVPGLAYDKRGQRLGYGGGFYDRYLAAFPGSKVGVCLEEFRLDFIPSAAHDQAVSFVATDAGIF